MYTLARKLKKSTAFIKLCCSKIAYDNLTQMATTLTFYTLTAIVPVIAVALGVAKGFGLDRYLQEQLLIDIAGQKEIMQSIVAYAHNMLANIRVDIISGVGMLILFYSAFKVLSNIEASFNQIWQVNTQRALGFKFTRYMALCLVGPAILILNNTIQFYTYKYLEIFHIDLWVPAKILTTTIVGGFVIWLYMFMPNYNLKFKYAAISGMIAGLIFQIIHSMFLHFQLALINYGAIYGGLAALPVLLIWLQTTWVILLFGAELCFLLEHNVTRIWEFNTQLLSWDEKFKILTDITNIFISKEKHELGSTSIQELATTLQISSCCLQEFINSLVNANILYQIASTNCYQQYILAINIKTHDLPKIFNSMTFNSYT